MSTEKPNAGKPVQLSKGFLIKQFQSTIWVPNPTYPTENALDSSTSPRKQIFRLNNHRMNDITTTTAASTPLHHSDRDCVTLPNSPAPSLPHEILPVLPLSPASALLASMSTSGASASAPKPFASHTLASPGSAQLPTAST